MIIGIVIFRRYKMKISDVVAHILYKECCKGKICKQCKFDTKNFNCDLSYIIEVIEKYDNKYICKENN